MLFEFPANKYWITHLRGGAATMHLTLLISQLKIFAENCPYSLWYRFQSASFAFSF
jgi:hypothetical protein